MKRKELFTIAKATAREFVRDDIGYLAAALAYYLFFSIFPLLLLAITLVGMFVAPEAASEFVFGTMARVAPGSIELLRGAIDAAFETRDNAGWAAIIGVGFLLFTASNAFDALDKAVNRAWGSEKAANFLTAKLTSFVMMLGIVVLLMISVVISFVLTGTRAITTAIGGEVPGSDIFWWAANVVGSLLVVFLAFLLMYKFLPRCEVSIHDAWPAALLAALLWTILKELFGLYLGSTFARFDATYGTLGAAFALITWLYLSSIIILVGAEFSSETSHVRIMKEHVTGEAQAKVERKKSPWLPDARRGA